MGGDWRGGREMEERVGDNGRQWRAIKRKEEERESNVEEGEGLYGRLLNI